jgi:RNA polymerase subunit RPABC4/transcription elongation factor Spt4
MSEIDWLEVQRKLEGRCYTCGGLLPDHIGVCPVHGEELKKKWEGINKGIDEIEDAVNYVLSLYRDV